MRKFDEKHVSRVLAGIQAEVPKMWLDNLLVEKDISPTILQVVEEAKNSPKVSDKLKEQIRSLEEAGEFSKKKKHVVSKYAGLIDRFVTRRINQEIKRGNLPPKGIPWKSTQKK